MQDPAVIVPRKTNSHGPFYRGRSISASRRTFHKDIRLGVEEAEALGVPLCVGTAVKHLYQLALSQLGPQSDFTQIVRIPEQWAGVEVSKKQV